MNPTKPSKRPRYKTLSLSNIAALLVATAFMGQLLGFLRTKLVNANFPTTGPNSTDAYFAAFNLPDFFFFTLAAGALGVAFMPVLSDRLHRGDKKGMWELSNSLMNLLAVVMLVVGVIIFVFAKPLIRHVVAPHMGEDQINHAASIMRFLAFNPLLFTISGVLASVQQTLGRFFFYAIAPLFYNTCIIISALVFSAAHGHNGGPGHLGLAGLGIGALIGSVLQLFIMIVGLTKTNFQWHPKIVWRSRDFRTILRNLPPRSLDQGIDQVNSIIETRFASRLGSGAITYYNNAYILSTAPALLIGTAISTAAFPRLNQRLSQGRPDLFRKDFLMVLRVLLWIALPVVVVSYFTRGYLARLIFTRDAKEIAIVFGYLVVAILFRTIYTLISRWFYAQKDTKTPLLVSIFTISFNILLAFLLARPSSYGVAGLALAQSIVAATEVSILFVIMLFRDHRLLDAAFWNGVVRIVSVGGFSVIAGFIMISIYPLQASDKGFITLGTKLLIIAAITFSVHIGVSALFGLEEVRPLFNRLKKIVLKPIRMQY